MKFKALQVAALLGVMSGASAVLVSASAPAQAGEQRLHSSSSATYGLVPPGQRGEERGGMNTGSKTTKSASNGNRSASNVNSSGGTPGSTPGSGGAVSNANTDGPQLEDPGMPSFNGGNNGGNGANGAGPNA